MRLVLSQILIFLSLISIGMSGQIHAEKPMVHTPAIIPNIFGQNTVCQGSTNVYTTDLLKTGYAWTVPAGNLIIGGQGTSSVTVTWNSTGVQTISVTYSGATQPGTLDVTVLPSAQVSVSVTPSSNPVCAGLPVTFTASSVNGGTTPAYIWTVAGSNISGATNPSYTYTPTNTQVVTCQLNSSLQCTLGNPAISPPIIMTVNPNLPLSVTITASSNPSCQGMNVTYSAVAVNGGLSPGYQWFAGVNPITGATSPVFDYIPANGEAITCQVTSNESCTTGNPATSNVINMNVTQVLPVSISVVASSNPACNGQSVTFTATPANGGLLPSYQWWVNGVNYGSTNSVYSYIPSDGDAVVCKLNSSDVCVTGNPANSVPVMMTVQTSLPVSIVIESSANPSCNGNPVTFTAHATNRGTSPSYEWHINAGIFMTTDSLYTYLPYDQDQIFCKVTSSLGCASPNQATSATIVQSVGASVTPVVNISSSGNTVCQGEVVTFTATPTNGGTSPSYEWKVGATTMGTGPSFSYPPANGDIVTCQMTSNSLCAFNVVVVSNQIIMSVSSLQPVSISIAATFTTVCAGTPVTFTATPVSGGTTPAYQWKVNGVNQGGSTPAFTYSPANNDVVTCVLSSSASCISGNPATSNAVNMTVNPSPLASVSITASANPSCSGQPVTFTATPINGGLSPSYLWKINSFDFPGGPTYTYTPSNGNTIQCIMTSSDLCITGSPAQSNITIMTVSPVLTVSVSVSSSSNPSCQGSAVNYTAVPTNGGPTPGFQWEVNGLNVTGATNAAYSYIPTSGDLIRCQLTSGIACPAVIPVFSAVVTQTVQPVVAASVVITASADTVCTGTNVTMTAATTGAGTTPTYQWYVDEVLQVGNNNVFSFPPGPTNIVKCKLTSSLTCVTGSPVTSAPVTVHSSAPLNGIITVTPSQNPFCQGTTVVFTSTFLNEGTLPVFEWKVNGLTVGTNSSTYSYAPSNGDFVTCKLTSNLGCTSGPVTSNPVLMLMAASVPASVTIEAFNDTVCAGVPVTFTTSVVNGGTSPAFQWYNGGTSISGATASTYGYTPVNGDVITCVVTSNYPCASGNPATSNAITMHVGSPFPASLYISTPTNPFCPGALVHFTGFPVNGGPLPVYAWKVNGATVGTNSTYSYNPANGDHVTCVLLSNSTCLSGANPVVSNEIILSDSTQLVAQVSVLAFPAPVCQGATVTCTATIANGGDNPGFQWKVNGAVQGTNSPVFSYTPVNSDVVTCQLTSLMSCVNNSPVLSNPVIINVTSAPVPSVTIFTATNPVCQGTNVTFTATPVNGGSAPVYQWRRNGLIVGVNSPSYSVVPLNSDAITCQITSNADCNTGVPVLSNQIIMTVNTPSPVGISISTPTNPFCQGLPVTITAIVTNGGTLPLYQWKKNAVNLTGATSGSYTYTPANGDVITCALTSNQACISNNPAISAPLTLSSGLILTPSVTISLVNSGWDPWCQGVLNPLKAVPTNGGTSPHYQWKVNGNITGFDSPNLNCYPNPGDVFTCALTSSLACATSGNPALSNPLSILVYPTDPVSVEVSVSSNPVCVGSQACFTCSVVNGGTNPVFLWRKITTLGTTNVGTNSPTYCSSTLADGDQVYCRVFSNATCPSPFPANSTPITMSVIPIGTASVVIAPSANPVCQGTMVTFSASPANGGSAPSYQWKVNSSNITGATNATYAYAPSNNDVIVCQMISNAACITASTVTSNTVTMTVSQFVAVSLGITTPLTSICQGTPVNFTAAPVNGGTNPSYQWNVGGTNVNGATNATYSYTPADGDVVFCMLTSNSMCTTGNPAQSNTVALNVATNFPVSVTINASAYPPCQGQSVTYTATPFNGGVNPLYEWKVGGISPPGATNSTYTFTPQNNDVVTCVLTSNINCPLGNPAESLPITMTFSPTLPVNVSVIASANPSCAGVPVTFLATPENGGPSPVYEWKVNGTTMGANQDIFSYLPANADVVSCGLTSNIPCPINNPATWSVTMTVIANQTAGISISTPTSTVCTGEQVTFTAYPVNGGASPQYTWFKNNVSQGPGLSTFTYAPADGDVVYCSMTSGISCITNNPVQSNSFTMSVGTSFPVSISISPSSNPVCDGMPVTYTATAVNGGLVPIYKWRVNTIEVASGPSPVYTFIPSNGQIVTCQVFSDLTCGAGSPALSPPVPMIVNPVLPVSISISASSNPECTGTPITFSAIPSNGGGTPAFQWRVNGLNDGSDQPTFTYPPTNGDVVTCQLTSSEICTVVNPVISNPLTMIIGSSFPVSAVVTASDNPICEATSVTFTVATTFGGPSPAYQWQVNEVNVSTDPTYNYFPVQGDRVRCIVTSSFSCATGNPFSSEPVIMVVLPVPVSISIVMDPLTRVCEGTPVTFTASAINQGNNPTYQWEVNTNFQGPNSPVYIYPPQDGDVVRCTVTSNATCATGNTVTSNSLIAMVDPGLPVSIAVTANPGSTICAGTTVTFNAAPVNEGTSPQYQWILNALEVAGATNTTYSNTLANGDVVICRVTSDATCATGNPATSADLNMTVDPNLIASVVISESANNICEGTSVTFTATPTNEGTAPVYQWQRDGADITGATDANYTYSPANGEVITVVMTSNAAPCLTGSPASSNPVTMIVHPVLTVSVSVAESANSVCAGTSVTFTATPTNGGITPSYQWKKGGINIPGETGSTLTYVPLNGEVISVEMTSNAAPCLFGSPATSNAVTMMVNPVLPVSVMIAESANAICDGTVVIFTATPSNGGTSPGYHWKKGGTNIAGATNTTYSYTPANGDVITVELTSSATPCTVGSPATSNPVTMIVSPVLIASVANAVSANPVCAGTSVTFIATPTSGGTTPTYQWKNGGATIPGATNATYTHIPADGEVITVVMTSNATPCLTGSPATSNPVTMIVDQVLTAGVVIAESANNICAGTSVTFTATPANGGASPGYQWKKGGINISGATNSTYSYPAVNGDVISVVMTSSPSPCLAGSPATSNAVTMMVNPILPVSVSTVASANPVCAGTAVTFTATATNPGTAPAYQWKNGVAIIPGATNSTYTGTPSNGDAIAVVLTSNATCATGNPATSGTVTMVVNSNLLVNVMIVSSATTVCAGTQVTLMAFEFNGGNAPVYQWRKNGVNVGGNSNTFTYTPVNGDNIYCELTSNALCPTGNPANSNTITITVNPLLPVSISVAALANPVCDGTLVNFSSSTGNGGSAPAYQWQVSGNPQAGATSSTYSYVPANNDQVTCILTSNAVCPTGNPRTSNTLAMTVNPQLPVSISINASANPVCAATNVTYTSTATNGGTSPSYQWILNGGDVLGATNSNYIDTPSNNDAVKCRLISNVTCANGNPATSGTVNMAVFEVLPVSVTISTPENPVCAGTLVTFTAVPVNGGTDPVFEWFLNGNPAGATNSTYSFIPDDGDDVLCMLTSNEICVVGNPARSDIVTMLVNPLLPVSFTISPDANPVCAGATVTFTATPTNGGSTPVYQWLLNGGSQTGATNATYSFIPVNGDAVSCALTSNAFCATGNPATASPIAVTVNPLFPVSVSISASPSAAVCAGTFVTFTATPSFGGASPVYQWKVNGINAGTNNPSYGYTPAIGDVVSCALTSSITCTTNNPASNSLTVSLSPSPVVTFVTCNDRITTTTALPFKLKGGLPLNGQYAGPGVNAFGVFNPAVAGFGIHLINYTYTNIGLCSSSASLTIDVRNPSPGPCGTDVIDYRDNNQVYPTIQIGSQCWFAKNLNIGTMVTSSTFQTDNCSIEKYCLNDNAASCVSNGGLYQWDELMRFSVSPGNQGLCPPGWHVPTVPDWLQLMNFYNQQSEAGTFLALPAGFNTLFGGVLYQNNTWSFYQPGLSATFFWTSQASGTTKAIAHGLNNKVASVSDYASSKANGMSIRCIKD